MFSSKSLLRKRRACVFFTVFFALCLVTGTALFTGCDTDGINATPPYIPSLYTPPNAVDSVWLCDYGNDDPSDDWYIAITDTTYTEYTPDALAGDDTNGDNLVTGKDAIAYSGTIQKIATTTMSLQEGYIYVKVDDDYKLENDGDEYFAVRWENYDGTGIKLWSSYKDGEVENSLADSESSYNDSYDSNWKQLESYTKVNVQVPLKGDLADQTYGGTVEITDITYTDIYSYMDFSGVSYSGVIVGTTNPSLSDGYIYIKYATTANFSGGSIAGNYYAIHWKNNNAGTIDLSGSSNGAGKPTLDEARREYTVANGYFSTYTTFNK